MADLRAMLGITVEQTPPSSPRRSSSRQSSARESWTRYNLDALQRATDGFSYDNRFVSRNPGRLGDYFGCSLDGQRVAVKRIKPRTVSVLSRIVRDAKQFASLRHPNLVRLLGYSHPIEVDAGEGGARVLPTELPDEGEVEACGPSGLVSFLQQIGLGGVVAACAPSSCGPPAAFCGGCGLEALAGELQALGAPSKRRAAASYEGPLLCVVYEHVEGTSLEEALGISGASVHARALSWAERVRVALHVTAAVAHLHARGLVHRNVRSSNVILAGRPLAARLVDFGLFPHGRRLLSTARGLAGYHDPLALATGSHTAESDVYSLGVLFLELLTGLPGGDEAREPSALAAWLRGALAAGVPCEKLAAPSAGPWDERALRGFFELALACAAGRPQERPTARQVLHSLERAWAGVASPEILADLLSGMPPPTCPRPPRSPPPPPRSSGPRRRRQPRGGRGRVGDAARRPLTMSLALTPAKPRRRPSFSAAPAAPDSVGPAPPSAAEHRLPPAPVPAPAPPSESGAQPAPAVAAAPAPPAPGEAPLRRPLSELNANLVAASAASAAAAAAAEGKEKGRGILKAGRALQQLQAWILPSPFRPPPAFAVATPERSKSRGAGPAPGGRLGKRVSFTAIDQVRFVSPHKKGESPAASPAPPAQAPPAAAAATAGTAAAAEAGGGAGPGAGEVDIGDPLQGDDFAAGAQRVGLALASQAAPLAAPQAGSPTGWRAFLCCAPRFAASSGSPSGSPLGPRCRAAPTPRAASRAPAPPSRPRPPPASSSSTPESRARAPAPPSPPRRPLELPPRPLPPAPAGRPAPLGCSALPLLAYVHWS
eukprot:tig00020927_g15951.t1